MSSALHVRLAYSYVILLIWKKKKYCRPPCSAIMNEWKTHTPDAASAFERGLIAQPCGRQSNVLPPDQENALFYSHTHIVPFLWIIHIHTYFLYWFPITEYSWETCHDAIMILYMLQLLEEGKYDRNWKYLGYLSDFTDANNVELSYSFLWKSEHGFVRCNKSCNSHKPFAHSIASVARFTGIVLHKYKHGWVIMSMIKRGMKLPIHTKLQRCNDWGLGMDRY